MSASEKGPSESGRGPGHSGESVPGDGKCCPKHGLFCDAAWAAIAKMRGFSPRQVQMLRRLVVGEGDRQIASALGLSLATVQTHMKRLYERLRVHCRIELGMQVSADYYAWRAESPPLPGCHINM
jgi:DNA-binding CsgD family transcriptional regulator